MRSKLIAWVAALAAGWWTLAAEAQSLGSGGVPEFDESMDRGLVPLFCFVAGGIGVMTLAAFVAVVFLRSSQAGPLRGA